MLELASEAAAPLAQFDAWILARGQSAYSGLAPRTIRDEGDPCAFVWSDIANGAPLTVRQAAYQIQQGCLDTLDEEARTALSGWADALIAADCAPLVSEAAEVAKALSERVSEYQQYWCEPSFKCRSGPDEPWICCDECGAELTKLNAYIANTEEGLCVMCGESR